MVIRMVRATIQVDYPIFLYDIVFRLYVASNATHAEIFAKAQNLILEDETLLEIEVLE